MPNAMNIKLNADDGQSLDLKAENIAKLKALFPEILTEDKIDFKVLKELLGEEIDEADERYSFTWNGKARARRLAQTPSTGTLRPCKAESKDWDTTQNLFIEGDNLEVLKLLQKSYHQKVKMIYIDPPYNTGKDFVYADDFRDNIKNYLELTGQTNEQGKKISTNSETSGRFHTNWLNMMYPRLKLARNLLRDDGVIFVSIDDGEIDNLRKLCSEIFGEENFVAQALWKKRSTPPNDKIIGANHDYILIYCKNIEKVSLNLRKRTDEQLQRYKNPDKHPKGVWAPGDLMANVKGGRYVDSLNFSIVNPKTNQIHFPSETERSNWRFSKNTIAELIKNDEIYFGEDDRGRPKLKRFLIDVKDGVTYPTIWDFVPFNTEGSSEMQKILGSSTIFESPKPVGLIMELMSLGESDDCLILDFFAGSGTTGHACTVKNQADGGHRRYILVQLPEKLDSSKGEQKTAADFCNEIGRPLTIAELTKERLRRAGAKIIADNVGRLGIENVDIGFKAFKLDSSNIKPWDANFDTLSDDLLTAAEIIKPERTADDVLFEILLKYGLDLSLPVTTHSLAGKTVFEVGAGALLVCLDSDITEAVAEAIGQLKTTLAPAVCRVVFRDAGFADDAAKVNAVQVLKQFGIDDVKSL